jgi:hypothetical protein
MPADELGAVAPSEAPWPPSVSPSALSCEDEADIGGEAAAAGLLPDPPPQPAAASAPAASSATNAAARPDLRLGRFDRAVGSLVLSGVGMSIPFFVLAFLARTGYADRAGWDWDV